MACFLLLLSGCSGSWATDYEAPVPQDVSRNWQVNRVFVSVPGSLTVSEENSLTPNADIVWHGDPPGDRRQQIQHLMTDALKSGSAGLRGGRRVDVVATMREFHAVTPAAVSRAPSAVHNISFVLQVRDARTGDALTEPSLVQADLEAHVGAAAVIAAQSGETQKRRITRHVANVVAGWLGTGPDQRRRFSSLGR